MIHQWSPRAKAPFIVLSAAMMSPERVEEELFGSEAEGDGPAGLARTCARGDPVPRRDRGHAADHPGQDPARADRPELSRGSAASGLSRSTCGCLSATSRNLQDEISAGRFREDLFYRLNVVPVRLPPLRERREDIPELVSHFLARFAAERRMPAPGISEEAMAALQAHDWPGNVRQLRNIIERTMILAPGDRVSCIEVDLLPPEILDNQGAVSGVEHRDGDHGEPAARGARSPSSANI